MKKSIVTTSILVFLILGLAGCGQLPDAPTPDQVLRDVERSVSNILIGKANGVDKEIPLTTLIIEEVDLVWRKGKDALDAEITAFVGDEKWKSEAKQAMTVRYGLHASKQWEIQGVTVNNPVIPVLPRE